MKTVSAFLIVFCLFAGIPQVAGPPGLAAASERATVAVATEVRALPGGLNSNLVLNSNSPEVVQSEGILVSTFPTEGMSAPSAHLNVPLSGNFDVFFHHINNGIKAHDTRTLYLGCVLRNASSKKVTVKVLQAASYLSQPDAPFKSLPAVLPNPNGEIFSGPGDRFTTELLCGEKQSGWPKKVKLKPGQTKLLFVRDIPVRKLGDPLNGRSGLVKLTSDGAVYAATLASFGTVKDGSQSPPSKKEWFRILKEGNLAGPRDRAASPPGAKPLVYGRVAGVARGNTWSNNETDGVIELAPGKSFAYPISTVIGGTFGTEQIQSAPLVVRYPDTAYEAHGNYAVEYDLHFLLRNAQALPVTAGISLQTPIKSNSVTSALSFYETAPERVFFRGTVEFSVSKPGTKPDDSASNQIKRYHVVEKQGQLIEPFFTATVQPGSEKILRVRLIYPPDATPPQVLTVSTLNTMGSL